MNSDRDSPEPVDEIRWWRPDWSSTFAAVGYRWLALLMLLTVLTLACVVPIFSGIEFVLVPLLVKLALLCGGAAIAVAIHVGRVAVQRRHEPFCIFCGYNLKGLPDHHRCPECGREYTFAMIDDYRRDPGWFIQRWKMRDQLPPRDAALDVPADAPRRSSLDGT